jgi:hypothetical protein
LWELVHHVFVSPVVSGSLQTSSLLPMSWHRFVSPVHSGSVAIVVAPICLRLHSGCTLPTAVGAALAVFVPLQCCPSLPRCIVVCVSGCLPVMLPTAGRCACHLLLFVSPVVFRLFVDAFVDFFVCFSGCLRLGHAAYSFVVAVLANIVLWLQCCLQVTLRLPLLFVIW